MRVLFCGGPADGRWIELPPNVQEHEVVAPPTPLEFANGTGSLGKVRYTVRPLQLLGYRMMVAWPKGEHNESASVLYAVVRRDVADHLRGQT